MHDMRNFWLGVMTGLALSLVILYVLSIIATPSHYQVDEPPNVTAYV